jgi:hypothetical protein
MPDLEKVLDAYEAALNEPRPELRAGLAAQALSDDVRFIAAHVPDGPPLDRQGFVDDCGVVQGWRPPGARLRRHGGVDAHHGWIRFAWEVSGPDGEPIEVNGVRVEGIDVAELAPDGRLATVVMFHGLTPPDTAE